MALGFFLGDVGLDGFDEGLFGDLTEVLGEGLDTEGGFELRGDSFLVGLTRFDGGQDTSGHVQEFLGGLGGPFAGRGIELDLLGHTTGEGVKVFLGDVFVVAEAIDVFLLLLSVDLLGFVTFAFGAGLAGDAGFLFECFAEGGAELMVPLAVDDVGVGVVDALIGSDYTGEAVELVGTGGDFDGDKETKGSVLDSFHLLFSMVFLWGGIAAPSSCFALP